MNQNEKIISLSKKIISNKHDYCYFVKMGLEIETLKQVLFDSPEIILLNSISFDIDNSSTINSLAKYTVKENGNTNEKINLVKAKIENDTTNELEKRYLERIVNYHAWKI